MSQQCPILEIIIITIIIIIIIIIIIVIMTASKVVVTLPCQPVQPIGRGQTSRPRTSHKTEAEVRHLAKKKIIVKYNNNNNNN